MLVGGLLGAPNWPGRGGPDVLPNVAAGLLLSTESGSRSLRNCRSMAKSASSKGLALRGLRSTLSSGQPPGGRLWPLNNGFAFFGIGALPPPEEGFVPWLWGFGGGG